MAADGYPRFMQRHPIDLPLQAAGLCMRAAGLSLRVSLVPLEASLRVAGAVCDRLIPYTPPPTAIGAPPPPPRPGQ
jgi:hypothetical protein